MPEQGQLKKPEVLLLAAPKRLDPDASAVDFLLDLAKKSYCREIPGKVFQSRRTSFEK